MKIPKAPVAEKPSTAEELAKRLHEAADSKSAVVPVGGGRASGMGGAPARCDLELHTTRLDRVLEHSHADMVVSVEAGITLEALQAELARPASSCRLIPSTRPATRSAGSSPRVGLARSACGSDPRAIT